MSFNTLLKRGLEEPLQTQRVPRRGSDRSRDGVPSGSGAVFDRFPHRLGVLLSLALVLAPAARAQFDLFLVEGNTERAAPAVYDFGSLYADETASAQFRLRNTSSAPATLTFLVAAGVSFTLTSPALPVGLAPQGAIDLRVAFRAT